MNIKFLALTKNSKQRSMIIVDLFLLSFALWLSISFRLGEWYWSYTAREVICHSMAVLFSLAVFLKLGLYRTVIRYMGQQAIFAVLSAVTVSSIIIAATTFATGAFMPRSVPFIYWCIAFLFVGGTRLSIRAYYQSTLQHHKIRVAIYGAGTSGLQIYKALIHGNKYIPVVFFDDNHSKQGTLIDGRKVQSSQQVQAVVEDLGVQEVFLAMPSVPIHRLQELASSLDEKGIQSRIIPGLEELLGGTLNYRDEINDSKVYENVLGRPLVRPNQTILEACITGKVVMVTGAGGSIGSELCRQIAANQPRVLILFDNNEYALYQIEKEIMSQVGTVEMESMGLYGLLGNAIDERRMTDIIKTFSVQTIYHAAAYKHVPIVESNVVEGVRNNVFGTYAAAKAAIAGNVETFVLISTDKAVRPTSIMGASKRLAEIVLQNFAERQSETRFCMVRFGNVLGSSGSVIPLFKEQINSGGPVTVTHPDITRYFMTIPEAAQLVLQAGSLARGGDVFVLDMGRPVKIHELAKRMISIMGFTLREQNNEGDIAIEFIGLRPGEKLFEELLVGNNVTGTEHSKIMRALEAGLPEDELNTCLDSLKVLCENYDSVGVHEALLAAVKEYKPDLEIYDYIWQRREELKEQEEDKKLMLSSNVQPLFDHG